MQSSFFYFALHLQPAPAHHYHSRATVHCVRLQFGGSVWKTIITYPHIQLEQLGHVTHAISPYHLAAGPKAVFKHKMARDLILCFLKWDFLLKGTKVIL